MLPMQRTQVKWPLAEEEVEQGNGQGGALMGHGPDEGDTRWGGATGQVEGQPLRSCAYPPERARWSTDGGKTPQLWRF